MYIIHARIMTFLFDSLFLRRQIITCHFLLQVFPSFKNQRIESRTFFATRSLASIAPDFILFSMLAASRVCRDQFSRTKIPHRYILLLQRVLDHSNDSNKTGLCRDRNQTNQTNAVVVVVFVVALVKRICV